MKYGFVIITILLIPLFMFSKTQEDTQIAEISTHVSELKKNQEELEELTEENDTQKILEQSSVILIQGSHCIAEFPEYKNIRGIPTEIDWIKIPDIGLPKSEIKMIEILQRDAIIYNGDTIYFMPNKWKFTAKTWTFEYQGRIPYLEKLEFLEKDLRTNILTYTKTKRVQNKLGYYQDKKTDILGIHFLTTEDFFNSINKIIIISAEENENFRLMQKKLNVVEQHKNIEKEESNNIEIESIENITNEIFNLETEELETVSNNFEIDTEKSKNQKQTEI